MKSFACSNFIYKFAPDFIEKYEEKTKEIWNTTSVLVMISAARTA